MDLILKVNTYLLKKNNTPKYELITSKRIDREICKMFKSIEMAKDKKIGTR